MNNKLLKGLIVIAFIALAGVYAWKSDAFSARVASNAAAEEDTSLPVLADFNFTNQAGEAFTSKSLLGKTVLLNFAYTSCGSVCPIVTKDLVTVQHKLPAEYVDKIMFVTVSIDPKHDTLEKIQHYIHHMNVDTKNWAWLLADEHTTDRLIKHMRVFDPRKEASTVADHRIDLILMDHNGHIVRQYSSKGMDTERLAQELMQFDDFSRNHHS